MGRGFGFGGGRKHFGMGGLDAPAGEMGEEGVDCGEWCIEELKDR
jgi:hypothetical protein